MADIVDHSDAILLAQMQQEDSNLARCYLAFHAELERLRLKISGYAAGATDDMNQIVQAGMEMEALTAEVRAADMRNIVLQQNHDNLHAEIERLRQIEKAAQEFRKITDQMWASDVFSHAMNNQHQQALWRALDDATPPEGGSDG